MRVAALYDVHGMPWALEAVLAEVDADAIVFGGDFVYGPYPRRTLERIRALDAIVLRGNCERDPVEWDVSQLSEEQVAWAKSLPVAAVVDGVTYCHATPTDDMPITTAATPDEDVARTFEGHTGTIVIGHTHHQFDRRIGDLRIVNAGSIGMAYEGNVAAYWTLVEDGEPHPMCTPFDVELAVREVQASGWPPGDEFVAENLLHAVTGEEAIEDQERRR